MSPDPVTEVNEETRALVLRAIHDTIAEGVEPADFGAALKAALDESGAFDQGRIEIEAEPARETVAVDAEVVKALLTAVTREPAPAPVNVTLPSIPQKRTVVERDPYTNKITGFREEIIE